MGVDVKWGITQTLIADLTYNTDFAQVEDDEAQVNLTRFSLFFPERRDFFLEGQDIFAFGGVGGGGGGGGGAGGGGGGGGGGAPPGANTAPNNSPILFYSRRIGLDVGQIVPIVVGGRLLGRTGKYNVGALNMQTDDVPRGRQGGHQLLGVSRHARRPAAEPRRPHRHGAKPVRESAPIRASARGADGQFQLYENVNIQTYYARTHTPGKTGDETSYRGRYDWNADRYGAQAEYLRVGEDFNPEVGFLRRTAFRRGFGLLRFSPRPKQPSFIRKLYYEASLDYITGPGTKLETREAQGSFRMELNNGDFAHVEVTDSFEGLTRAVQRRRRRHRAGGQLLIHSDTAQLSVRPAATHQRRPGLRLRRLLRRHAHDARAGAAAWSSAPIT